MCNWSWSLQKNKKKKRDITISGRLGVSPNEVQCCSLVTSLSAVIVLPVALLLLLLMELPGCESTFGWV